MRVKMSECNAFGQSNAIIYLATCDPRMGSAEAAELVFSALEQVGFGLDRYNNVEPVNIPFTREGATQMYISGTTYTRPGYRDTGNIFFGKHARPGVELTVQWNISSDIACLSVIKITLTKKQLMKSMKRCMELLRNLIQIFHPAYALVGTRDAYWRQCGKMWMGIPGLYWLNYFGKEFIDFIGADHILGCGWERTESFTDGIFAWTAPSIDLLEDEVIANEQKYRERLGLQYFSTQEEHSKAAPPVFMEMREKICQ